MSIGKKAGGAPPPTAGGRPGPDPGEWCVPVSASVLAIVPNDLLRPWMAVELFARTAGECWPSNKALVPPMGAGSVRVVQAMLERLEDFGVVVRKIGPGNRRVLVLTRRTAAGLSPAEWSAMAATAARRAAGRAALAKGRKVERKRYKPPTKVVG